MAVPFKNAKFIKSAVQEKDYPILRDKGGNILPEIAVVGRSNVGKSSLLGNLFFQKSLVKVSSTPGKTQLLNFFNVDNQISFVDLPGYGYAKVPLQMRKQWHPMIENYFKNRESLKLILFLFDIRRTPSDEDLNLLEWLFQTQKEIILVLTKVDKVNQSERIRNAREILKTIGANDCILYSVVKNLGRKELIQTINHSLKE